MSESTPKLSPEKLQLLQRRLKGASGNVAQERTIQPRKDQEPAPLSFAQNQMWLIDQLAPGAAAYNLPIGYRLNGPLKPDGLQASFNEVIRRHEILRTTFSSKDGEAVQIVHPAWTLQLGLTDLEHLSAGQRESALHEHATAEAVKPFDLHRLPLIRATLFKLGALEHVLIVNVHHILADGLSAALLLNELDVCYRAFYAGVEATTLPSLPVQYADFAIFERQESGSNEPKTQATFWKEQLSGNLPTLELPWDKPRPALQSFKGSNVFFDIPAPLCARLQKIAAEHDCTFFMAALAAFYAILHRYSGARDLIVGTPVANRTLKEVQPLIGNFLNIVALRCDVEADSSFAQLLRKTRDATLNAFSHREVPFEQVVEQLHLPRDPSRNPIFQAMLQVLPRVEARLSDLKVSDFHFDLGFSQFDLSLHLYEAVDGYKGRFEYCTDLLNRETVNRLAGHFLNLLQQIAADPQQPVSKISILSEAERRQILVDWNSTAAPYAREMCVNQLFETQAQRTPDRTAVVFEQQQLTYKELNARANALAADLRRQGVSREVIVGIYVERSIDMLVGVLGVLKAGGAYVPLDPTFPRDRLGMMIQDTQMPVIITQQKLLSVLPTNTAKIICVDSTRFGDSGPISDSTHSTGPNPESLAYILFTSGSTGRPKGVQISHRALVNFLASMQRKPGLRQEDTLLAVTTLSFDIAGLELFLPLVVGAKIVIAPRETTMDGHRLATLMNDSATTVLQATPATWRMLIEAGWAGDPRLKILCGGEPLTRDLADQLLKRCAELWNMYGPTETTVWSTCCRVANADTLHIGRPIDNTDIYILDESQRPVPVGIHGELLIGGDGLARGYWQRPELTAEKFIPHPFKPGQKLYRTGDLARYRTDGNVDCLGRLDFQVKIRGFRIELGEIENQLVAHPAVKQAVVVAREDATGEKRLVAYFVARANPAPTASQLREHLRNSLPDYMLPAMLVVLPTLPLTPNGKIDHKALPAPDESLAASAKREIVAPRNETEASLCAIWANVLAVQIVGVHDNFFELGGHSLLALKVISRIRQQFDIEMPLSVIFATPTVERLAEKISELQIAKLGADELESLLAEIESNPGTSTPTVADPNSPSGERR